MSKTLSIFCDESGDFGPFSNYSSRYIVSFVFHDQSIDINKDINTLKSKLSYLNCPDDMQIHAMPIIRGEYEFEFAKMEYRRKILSYIAIFFRKASIYYKSVVINKHDIKEEVGLEDALKLNINELIAEYRDYLNSFDKIIIYYDSGQKKLTRVLDLCFDENFENYKIRKFLAKDKYLLQVADFVCSLELLNLKFPNLTNRELKFFRNRKTLKNNYLKLLKLKKLKI